MLSLRTPEWQRRRSRFNHDWMKNGFIPAVSSCLNSLQGRVESSELLVAFFDEILPEWEKHRETALELPRLFEEEMSPRILLNTPPLSLLPTETRFWLGAVVHGLWLARYPVREWVDDVSACVAEADSLYWQLREALGQQAGIGGSERGHAILPELGQFMEACFRLSKAIEQFPSDVRVI
jgi:hypothetical protein